MCLEILWTQSAGSIGRKDDTGAHICVSIDTIIFSLACRNDRRGSSGLLNIQGYVVSHELTVRRVESLFLIKMINRKTRMRVSQNVNDDRSSWHEGYNCVGRDYHEILL